MTDIISQSEVYIAIITYNSLLSESESCCSLNKISGYFKTVIIFDNSDMSQYIEENKEFSKKNNYIYISKEKNLGLSKAYNIILDYLDGKDGIVIWMDDDTWITKKYFELLLENIDEEFSIYVPIIKAQNGKIYSPNNEGILKNRQIKNIESATKITKFNAINSCMAVNLSVYRNYRYDENLFLDQVDHDFCRTQRIRNVKSKVLPIIIEHNLSMKGNTYNSNSIKKRYKILVPDLLYYYRKRGRIMGKIGYIKILLLSFKESMKCKDLSIMKNSIKLLLNH